MKKEFLVLAILSVLLAGCDFSLAGDVTPPPNSVVSAETTAMPIEAPTVPADLSAGADIYATRCAPCHGVTGLGDGEQAGQLPFPPPAIGSSEVALVSTPMEWFRVISQGRLQRYMPPFESALTVQERWDVLAYTYSLGWDRGTLDRGAEIYASNRNEIDRLLGQIPSLSIDLSAIETLGLPMPEAEAATAYLQAKAIGVDQHQAVVDEATPQIEVSASTVSSSFSGQVVYGSGGQLPEGLEARLYGFDHTDQVVTKMVPVSADGRFEFTNVPVVPGRIFFVQVDYKGLSFFSEFLTVQDQADTFSLDVPIYDTTSDPSQLSGEKMQLILDFPRASTMRVVESVTISNLGDRAVAPDETGKPLLHFTIPQLASNLSFEEGELGRRYIPDETGFGDTRAVIPGIESYSLLFAYEMSYNNSLSFPIQIDLPTRSVAVFLAEGSVEMQSEIFRLQGSQVINGSNYSVYMAEGAFSQGDEILVELTGSNPAGRSSSFAVDDNLLIGMAALTAVVGFTFFWLRRLPAEAPRAGESILQKIVALDESYEKRKISRSAYNGQRKALKARLRREIRTKSRI